MMNARRASDPPRRIVLSVVADCGCRTSGPAAQTALVKKRSALASESRYALTASGAASRSRLRLFAAADFWHRRARRDTPKTAAASAKPHPSPAHSPLHETLARYFRLPTTTRHRVDREGEAM